MPETAILIDDPPMESADAGGIGVPGGMIGGEKGGVPGGMIADILRTGRPPVVERPPDPPKRVEPTATAPIPVKPPRISVLQMATPIHKVDPIYPSLARSARISGVVEMVGVLGTDGRKGTNH